MLKKVQKKLHRWLCVPSCFPVTISDQLQALTTSDSYVSLATQGLDGLRGVLVWEGVSAVLETWHFLDKGLQYNVEHHA